MEYESIGTMLWNFVCICNYYVYGCERCGKQLIFRCVVIVQVFRLRQNYVLRTVAQGRRREAVLDRFFDGLLWFTGVLVSSMLEFHSIRYWCVLDVFLTTFYHILITRNRSLMKCFWTNSFVNNSISMELFMNGSLIWSEIIHERFLFRHIDHKQLICDAEWFIFGKIVRERFHLRKSFSNDSFLIDFFANDSIIRYKIVRKRLDTFEIDCERFIPSSDTNRSWTTNFQSNGLRKFASSAMKSFVKD